MQVINQKTPASNIKSKSTITNLLSKITNWFHSSSTPSKNNISKHNKPQLFNPPQIKQSANTLKNTPAKSVVQQIKDAKADISHNQRATEFMTRGFSLHRNEKYKF